MSIKSLSDLAVRRDYRGVRSGDGPPRVPSAITRGAGSVSVDAPTPYQQALTAAIPSEALAGYTALVGAVVAAVGRTSADQLLAVRWVFYVVFLAVTGAAVAVGYATKRTEPGAFRWPWLEMGVATLAAAIWGLVMPGNPLTVKMGLPAATVWTASVTIFGAAMVSGSAALLLRPAGSLRPKRPGDAPTLPGVETAATEEHATA